MALPWYSPKFNKQSASEAKPILKAPKQFRNPKPPSSFGYPQANNLFGNSFGARGGEYVCESCDHFYQNDYQLQKHKAQHIICNIDGCQIEAHFKIIEFHRINYHASGVTNKDGFSNSPEDVSKYVAERKKKFPTPNNIKEKENEKMEKEKRGEIIKSYTQRKNLINNDKDKNDKNKKPFRRINNTHVLLNVNPRLADQMKRKKKNIKEKQKFSNPLIIEKNETEEHNDISISGDEFERIEEEQGKSEAMKVFEAVDSPNIPTFFNADIGSGSDDDGPPAEVAVKRPAVQTLAKPEPSNALAVLGNAYETSDTESEAKDTRTEPPPAKRRRKRVHKPKNSENSEKIAKEKASTVRKVLRGPNPRNFLNLTTTTLANTIFKEDTKRHKNWISQCIRYVVNNNFFLDS